MSRSLWVFVVKLTQKDWRNAAIAGVSGVVVLSLVGWNVRKMTGFKRTNSQLYEAF